MSKNSTQPLHVALAAPGDSDRPVSIPRERPARATPRPRSAAAKGSRPPLVFLAGLAVGVGVALPLALLLSRQPARPVVAEALQIQSLITESQRALSGGKPEQALPLLVTADSLGLKNEVVQNNLCVTFIMLHRHDDAIEACKVALVLNPNFALARNNLRWAQAELAKAENRPSAAR